MKSSFQGQECKVSENFQLATVLWPDGLSQKPKQKHWSMCIIIVFHHGVMVDVMVLHDWHFLEPRVSL